MCVLGIRSYSGWLLLCYFNAALCVSGLLWNLLILYDGIPKTFILSYVREYILIWWKSCRRDCAGDPLLWLLKHFNINVSDRHAVCKAYTNWNLLLFREIPTFVSTPCWQYVITTTVSAYPNRTTTNNKLKSNCNNIHSSMLHVPRINKRICKYLLLWVIS